METYTCYHGTHPEAAQSILTKQHFRLSASDTEWAGHGIYFFLDDNPQTAYTHAFKWVKYIRHRDCSNPSVLKATISINTEDILDLRIPTYRKQLEDLRYTIFCDALERAKSKHIPLSSNMLNPKKLDCFAINEFCNSADPPFLAVIAEIYINFDHAIQYQSSKYPNCTILCLRDESLITNITLAKGDYYETKKL